MSFNTSFGDNFSVGNNTPNDDIEAYEAYKNLHMNVVLVTTLVFAFLGSLGNFWFTLILSLTKSLRKPNYRLLLGVVVSDLLVDFIFIPFETLQIFVHQNHRIYFGGELCPAEVPIYKVAAYASIIGQFLFALNRGTAVFLPLIYRKYMTNRLVTLVFFFSGILLPAIFFFGQSNWSIKYQLDKESGDCDYKFLYQWVFHFFDILFNYLPIFGSLLVYAGIVVKILVTTRSNRGEVVRRARGTAIMLLCMLVLATAFLAGPIYRARNGNKQNDPILTLWFRMFYRISYVINPVFYLFSNELRQCSIDFFKEKFLRKNKTHVQSFSNKSDVVSEE